MNGPAAGSSGQKGASARSPEVAALVERHGLSPHPEGGWYRETYRTPEPPPVPGREPGGAGGVRDAGAAAGAGGVRGAITSILYLLERGQRSHWHQVDADELWYWQAGGPLLLQTWDPAQGEASQRLDPASGAFHAAVPAYTWQSAAPDGAWTLVSCAVAPAFTFQGFAMAPPGWTPAVGHPVLQPILMDAISSVGAVSGTVHLLGRDGVLHLSAQHGLPAQVMAIVRRVPVGKGMAGLAVERAGPVSACNIQQDTSGDVRPGARATGMEGAIVVPIFSERAGVVGALGVACRSARDFTPEETLRLVELGRRAAQACERSGDRSASPPPAAGPGS